MAWNRPTNETVQKATAKKSNRSRLLVVLTVGAAVLLAASLAWFFMGGDAEPTVRARPKSSARIANVGKSVKASSVPQVAEPTNAVKKVEPPPAPEYKIVRTITNTTGYVTEDRRMPDGSLVRVVTPPKQVWHNAADQMIAMALSIQAGQTAAPLPSGVTDEDFRKALKQEIVIEDDDSEKVKELKRQVRETRKEILDLMENSHMSFSEIIQSHHKEMNANTESYQKALEGLDEVKRNGTAEDVHKYLTVMNAALQQLGAKELPYDEPKSGHRPASSTTKGTDE